MSAAQEAQPEGRLCLDAEGRITDADAHAGEILANVPQGFTGLTILQLAAEADRPRVSRLLQRLEPDQAARTEVSLEDDFGRMVLCEIVLCRQGDGSMLGFLHDISERRLAEQVAAATQAVTSAMAHAESPERAIEALLGSLGRAMGWAMGAYWIESHDDALERVVVWRDAAGPAVEAESSGELRRPRARTLAGRALDSRRIGWVSDVLQHRRSDLAELAATSSLRAAVAVPLIRRDRANGVIEFFSERPRIPDEAVKRALTAAAGQVSELLGILEERHQLVTSLARLALTDELTGLPNRRAWEEALPRELARAARGGHPVCIAVLDLDNFKAFNDEHGHQAGDHLLTEAARAWQQQLRASDLLARYGGEEFAALIPAWPLATAVEVVERLRAATPGQLTASAGVASWTGSESGAELFGRADAALYEAKQAGRDRTVTAPSPDPLAAG